MNICSGEGKFSHDEVCYEVKYCPVCELNNSLQSEIDDLQKAIEENEKRISELENLVK